MQIEVSSDNHVNASERLIQEVEADVADALAHFRDRLTRVEVHLGDENATKGGTADKRCVVEARPAGQDPVAVTNHAATLPEAWRGALQKLANLLGRRFGRQDDHKGGPTIRRDDR